MDTVSKFIDFLKERRSFQEKKQRQLSKNNPSFAEKHAEAARGYTDLIGWLERFQSDGQSTPTQTKETVEDLFSLNPLQMDDLPKELVSELNITESDEQDAQILELLKIAQRPLDLNELLVGCLRKYKVSHKRNLLNGRLYRLAKKGEVHTVGKGRYALGPGSENEGEPTPLELEMEMTV